VERLIWKIAAPLLALAFAAGPARAREPLPVVAGVAVRVPPGEDAAVAEGLVELKSGDPLSPRALRRTVELIYKLGRFSNVVVRTLPEAGSPGRVMVVIDCLPRRTVRAVTFDNPSGQLALSDSKLRRAAEITPGDEFDAKRVERAVTAVRTLMVRLGYRAAEVSTESSGGQDVNLRFELREGKPTLLGSLSFSGAGLPAPSLAAGLKTQVGNVLDEDLLDQDVQTLRAELRRAGYYRGRVGRARIQASNGEAQVTIPVQPGPRFTFSFPGSRVFSDRILRAQLGYDGEHSLDEATLSAAANNLAAFYRKQGYLAARVTWSEVGGGDRVGVPFQIEEGRRYRVGEVRFTGATFHSSPWLAGRLRELLQEATPKEALPELVRSKNAPPPMEPTDLREVYDEPSWNGAVSKLVDLYRGEGFLEAVQEGTRLEVDARRGVVDVELRLREGPRTLVESIAFEGNEAASSAELATRLELAPGQPLSLSAVERTRMAVLALYAQRGYAYARVDDLEEFSDDRTRASVRFRVEEGPQVRISRLVITGNKRTLTDVVKRTLSVKSGDIYDPAQVARSQSTLLRLGVFRSVALRLNDAEVPEARKDLTVELVERPWQTLSQGVGFSLADGPRASIEFSRPNLAGRALELTARAKVNYPLTTFRPDLEGKKPQDRIEGRAEVGLHAGQIQYLPFDAGLRLDVIAERLHRRAYDLARVSAVPTFDLPITSRIGLTLQYEFEVDNIHKSTDPSNIAPTQGDLEQLRFPDGVTTLHSIRTSLTFDFRDNSAHPRIGWYASATAELVDSLGQPGKHILFGLLPGSDVHTNMLKLSGVLSGYLPIGAQSVFALSLRGGQVLPLDSSSVTIGPKRFFMGGAASMRGYAEDEMLPEDLRAGIVNQVRSCAGSISGLACSPQASRLAGGTPLISEGGQAFALLKAELRVPLGGSLEGGLFTDVGNLWLDPAKARLSAVRINAGFGLRFTTPIGPVVLDFGFNVAPDSRLNERLVAPHFSIGLF
jgi:outer membrane protein assembly complex protein YaeT